MNINSQRWGKNERSPGFESVCVRWVNREGRVEIDDHIIGFLVYQSPIFIASFTRNYWEVRRKGQACTCRSTAVHRPFRRCRSMNTSIAWETLASIGVDVSPGTRDTLSTSRYCWCCCSCCCRFSREPSERERADTVYMNFLRSLDVTAPIWLEARSLLCRLGIGQKFSAFHSHVKTAIQFCSAKFCFSHKSSVANSYENYVSAYPHD